jgi:site-specific DNA-methyltransferase (adenine-specific)
MTARYLIIACTSAQRYFDLDAVRAEGGTAVPEDGGSAKERSADRASVLSSAMGNRTYHAYGGAPPLDHWLTDDPWRIPLESMVPERVCTVCGEPSRRLVQEHLVDPDGRVIEGGEWASGVAEGKGAHSNKTVSGTRVAETLGWTDCGHNAWRAGRTFNPIPEGPVAIAKYLLGDVFERMAGLPDASFDLVMCSPPFYGLRDYLEADDPAKVHEMGSEASPAEWMDVMMRLSAEWRRLLAPHGSIAVELGDKYSDSDSGGDGPGWPLAKSLMFLPTLYGAGLAYGQNLLTGRPSPAGRWRVRNLVVWARPNPAVGSLGDKYRPSTSFMTVAATSPERYFDLEGVRTTRTQAAAMERLLGDDVEVPVETGAPPLDWWMPMTPEEDYFSEDLWVIPTYAFPGAHFATWPPMLCVRPIKSMVPEKVCTTCGLPRRRITEPTEEYLANLRAGGADEMYPVGTPARPAGGLPGAKSAPRQLEGSTAAQYRTVGWTDCGHDTWRLGCVLDPFAGTGTTLSVATGLGRDAVGIDLDKRNIDYAEERIGGLFFERG